MGGVPLDLRAFAPLGAPTESIVLDGFTITKWCVGFLDTLDGKRSKPSGNQ